jgi:hypothetical protein
MNRAARCAVRVPLPTCATKDGLPELHTGQLRDISRAGILLHSQVCFEIGSNLEVTSCLPQKKERTTGVLVRPDPRYLDLEIAW